MHKKNIKVFSVGVGVGVRVGVRVGVGAGRIGVGV